MCIRAVFSEWTDVGLGAPPPTPPSPHGTGTVHVYLHVYLHVHVLMRDELEGRKKEASKAKQTTRQSNTAHPRQSLFLRKMSCLGWDSIYIYIDTSLHD